MPRDLTSALLFSLITAACVAAAALGAPPVAVAAGGYLLLFLGSAAPVSRAMLDRARRLARARHDELGDLAEAARAKLLEQATHGETASRLEAVLETRPPTPAAREALDRLAALDQRIDEFLREATESPGHGEVRAIHPTTLDDATFVAESSAVRPYGTREHHPSWVRGPLGALLEQVGVVLDEVRALHTAQIERAVLLLTFWSRALLIGLSPWLAGLTFADPPLDGAFAADDVPWALATAVAVACAVRAPWLADRMMDRTEAGARLRRRMIAIEMPLALAVALTAPAWTAVIFATGWTNHAQRPVFDWLKLGRFIVAVSAAQAAGLLLDGVPAWAIPIEIAAAFVAIGITGGSYGAMFLISGPILVYGLTGGRAARYRSARAAREDLLMASGALEVLAAELRAHAERDDAAGLDTSAYAAARQMREAAALLERSGGVVPRGLRALAGTALQAAKLPRLDPLADEEPRVYTLEPMFAPDELATRRVDHKGHRKALGEALRLMLEEAKAHGEGAVSVRFDLAEGRLSMAVANPVRPDDRAGRGTGRAKLASACEQLPDGTVAPLSLEPGTRFQRRHEQLCVATISMSAAVLE